LSRIVSRAESWERVYASFQSINFTAFDFNTIKQSLLDYVKLHFPETFNDYIESSEFIAIVETFAYIAELLAYRIDLNAHENFISTAQRRDSILRLAKLVSYTASRPLPARGLVKIATVSTTENVLDANGIDLANQTIRWNDVSNSSWKEQFILVMNRVLQQEFGSVSPFDRFQVQDVLFEIYGVNLVSPPNGVFSYSAVVNSTSLPMELVPVAHDEAYGIVERRPENNINFTLLYGSDGVGDASETTGFFCFTKQGTLQKFFATFDGITPNLVYEVSAANVNETDVWVNQVNATTREILDEPPDFSFRVRDGRSGEWHQVDLAHAQNVIFNTNPNRNKYEIETRDDNKIRVIFGDGEFADIPSGAFEIWARTSVDENVIVPQSAVVDQTASFTYLDKFGRTQTFTFTFTLIGSLQNASAAEDLEHIRKTAPAVYYTQDRMVNGEDYNVFMLQDPSILKLRAINRTFAGDSKYIPWADTSQTYENVKIFSDDGRMYFSQRNVGETTPEVDNSTLIINYIEPLLSTSDVILQLVSAGVPIENVRRVFSTDERNEISAAMTPPPVQVDLYYDKVNFVWRAHKRGPLPPLPAGFENYPVDFIPDPLIYIDQPLVTKPSYVVTRSARRLTVESSTTAFWNTNDSNRVIEYDTLNSDSDEIVVLKANVNNNYDGVLRQNWHFLITGQEVLDSGTELGLPDIHKVTVLPADENEDGVPDNLNPDEYVSPGGVAEIFKPKLLMTGVNASRVIQLPIYFIGDNEDVLVYTESVPGVFDVPVTISEVVDSNNIGDTIVITDGGISNSDILIIVNEYVYFNRASVIDQWMPVESTYAVINDYRLDAIANPDPDDALFRRYEGRAGLNFAWFHRTAKYHLVDPSPSNIIDTFIIPKGYYIALKRWLEDPLAVQPTLPTPLDLRSSYGYLLDNKMISDTVVLHPGRIKLLFGSRAAPELQASLVIVRSGNAIMTDNQIRTVVVTTVRNFFDISKWEFGETFFFTELAAAIHNALPGEISTVVLVPSYSTHQFGDMFQVAVREDEVLYPDITVADVDIVTGLTATNLRKSTGITTTVTITTGGGGGGGGSDPLDDDYIDETYIDPDYLETLANNTP
jgi:hypothetical protein